MNTVPRTARSADIGQANARHCFEPPAVLIESGLSGWKAVDLTTLEAEPHQNHQAHRWERAKFQIDIVHRDTSFTFTAYLAHSSFPFPEVSETMRVAAYFKRDRTPDKAGSELTEIRHMSVVARRVPEANGESAPQASGESVAAAA